MIIRFSEDNIAKTEITSRVRVRTRIKVRVRVMVSIRVNAEGRVLWGKL